MVNNNKTLCTHEMITCVKCYKKSTLNHDTFCWKYCRFSSQMFTNAEYELRTASMNSHSNALLLDDVIRKLTQHCFLQWHVSWKNSNVSYYRSTNVTLCEDINFTDTPHTKNQPKIKLNLKNIHQPNTTPDPTAATLEAVWDRGSVIHFQRSHQHGDRGPRGSR